MTFKYKDIEININVAGEGSPVLLLHGWGCSNEIFKQIQAVLATSYKTYNFDFPGFGKSDEPTEVWGTEEYTRMVEQFVKENHIERPALVGHSFGGRISIIFASRNETSRVVLVDAAGIKPKRPFKYYWKVYTFKTMKWLCNTFLPKKTAQAIIDKRRKGAGSSDYNNASPKMRAILSKVVNEDLTPLLPKIKAPTLLFWGNMDTATPLSDAKKMEKLIPDAGLVVAHGTGHFSFLENPGLFTAVMKNFFKIK
ncbi:MAG: alpha/beta hydrolase [Bacteroidaceae bacterium]|jgi:pimeloyl-ACP methyl ester carboxylesterase|nr:alpha/beta hydrolase [Bacteroidaceae bacterium]